MASTPARSPREQLPVRRASELQGLEILAWGLVGVGAVAALFAAAGLLVMLGGIALLVSVVMREQRDAHRELSRRVARVELLLEDRQPPG